MTHPVRRRARLLALAGAATVIAGGTLAGRALLASDHQDTPEVELSPRSDINDIYAFPAGGTSTDRIVLVMTTSSPILPPNNGTARFDPALIYQFKIDNSSPFDGVEDLVIQVTFEDSTVGQVVNVRGPAAPQPRMAPQGQQPPLLNEMKPLLGTEMVRLANVAPIRGLINSAAPVTGGASNAISVFAGLRDDPFFIDLEQFFRIIPDRRPASGPLAALPETPTATGFRNPGVEFLTAFKANTLAIVLEMPEALLTGGRSNIGIWGTISR